MEHRYLFNFAVSYMGGGRKRLEEYSRWFNRRGGAWFIVHANCASLRAEFPINCYFTVHQSHFDRIFRDCAYIGGILQKIGKPLFYYSYGIPIYARVGQIDWFHCSNVLPLSWKGVPLSFADRLKFRFLGDRILQNLCHADVISAESQASLSLFSNECLSKLILSVNGSDDELSFLSERDIGQKDNTATILGTYSYKAVGDSYRIFQMLRRRDPALQLVIIGDKSGIPQAVRGDKGVNTTGLLNRKEVLAWLRKTKYYISTTRVENSYNAAAEGVFLADESYISDIPPHRELLEGERFTRVSVPDVETPLLHVQRRELTGKNLKSWRDVVKNMISEIEKRLTQGGECAEQSCRENTK